MGKILLVGLDAADWGVIRPLMEAGMMPAFQSLIEKGSCGTIRTLEPSFSPMLWTSIATGKLADKHQILSFLEPNEKGDGVRPVSGSSRKAKAVWNILESQERTCNVIGWWPSHPVEPVKGFMASERFHKFDHEAPGKWQLPEGSVWPLSLRDQIEKLRVHPSSIKADKIQVFVPEAAQVDQEKDISLQIIQALVAESESVFNTAMWAIQHTQWDFTAVYFKELDEFSHHFMKYHPPCLPGLPDEQFKLYYNVITAAYTMYDAMLYQMLQTIPKDTTVIVLSDHGFYSDHRRMLHAPAVSGGISMEHNPKGVLCMAGPAIKKAYAVHGASLLDVAPTILALAEIPIGQDMDGKVLSEAFMQEPLIEQISSWEEKISSEKQVLSVDTFAEAGALQRLIDLGYIEALDEETEIQVRAAIHERTYNLSRVYASTGRLEKAIELLEALYEEDRVEVRYNMDLIRYYLQVGRAEKARHILTHFRKFDISGIPNFDYLEGKILFAENKLKEALHCYQVAKEQSPKSVNLLLDMAAIWALLEKDEKAKVAYQEAIRLDLDCVSGHLGLSSLMNRAGEYELAIEHALDGLKIHPADPSINYQIGYALFQLKEYEAAASALENCLKLNPAMSRPRNLLVTLYRDHLPNTEKYEEHFSVFHETRKGEIVVVSGLPRSGTSLMMQILERGGMPLLTDTSVQPDLHNPNGYFEYDPVKRSKTDVRWLEEATGKAVKVISPLLPCLTIGYKLKIIFMERDMEEVMLSQQLMLASRKKVPAAYQVGQKEIFQKHMREAKEWAEAMHHVHYHVVNYNQLVEDPLKAVKSLNRFLGNYLDENKMAEAVDQNLYRNKRHATTTKSI